MEPHIHVRVKKLHPDAQLPSYGRPGDAGLDLSSIEERMLAPGERALIGTGIAVAIPEGTVSLVWDRSGLAAKQGVTTIGGVIDHTYRGEYKVVLLNTSCEPYQIRKGDRIAQLLIQPILTAQIEEVTELPLTDRGEGAFGSSGR